MIACTATSKSGAGAAKHKLHYISAGCGVDLVIVLVFKRIGVQVPVIGVFGDESA